MTIPSTLTTINGAQGGDEGKGKVTFEIIHRKAQYYGVENVIVLGTNGGSNAGHTIKIGKKSYHVHYLTSGSLIHGLKQYLGCDKVLHPQSLRSEYNDISKDFTDLGHRTYISSNTHITLSCHVMKDKCDNGHIGTTSKGIGPTYSAKYNRTGVRLIDVQHAIKNKNLFTLIQDKYKDYNHYYNSGKSDISMRDAIIQDIEDIVWVIETFNIVDLTYFKRVLFSRINKHYIVESSNATLIDINYGTYPYVTSSSCITSNLFSSLCLTPLDIMSLNCTFIGVVKSYPTRVGAGILPTEITDKSISEKIIEGGAEFGVTTGRRRRPGWPDCVLINYANMVNGFNHINLTRLDNLSQFDKIMICIAYLQDEESGPLSYFPYHHNDDMSSISPQYIEIDGWKDFDFTKVKNWSDLHPNVLNYIKIIEKYGNVEVKSVNTGQELGMIVFK